MRSLSVYVRLCFHSLADSPGARHGIQQTYSYIEHRSALRMEASAKNYGMRLQRELLMHGTAATFWPNATISSEGQAQAHVCPSKKKSALMVKSSTHQQAHA